MWIEQTEGAKFWLKVFNQLKNRGLHEVPIAIVNDLRGFPEVIETVYPQVQLPSCIVHLIRKIANVGVVDGPQRADRGVKADLPS